MAGDGTSDSKEYKEMLPGLNRKTWYLDTMKNL